MLQLRDRTLRAIYFRRFWRTLRQRPDGILLRTYAIRCVLHFHFYRLARQLEANDRPLINTL
jgi:hypothetical protein